MQIARNWRVHLERTGHLQMEEFSPSKLLTRQMRKGTCPALELRRQKSKEDFPSACTWTVIYSSHATISCHLEPWYPSRWFQCKLHFQCKSVFGEVSTVPTLPWFQLSSQFRSLWNMAPNWRDLEDMGIVWGSIFVHQTREFRLGVQCHHRMVPSSRVVWYCLILGCNERLYRLEVWSISTFGNNDQVSICCCHWYEHLCRKLVPFQEVDVESPAVLLERVSGQLPTSVKKKELFHTWRSATKRADIHLGVGSQVLEITQPIGPDCGPLIGKCATTGRTLGLDHIPELVQNCHWWFDIVGIGTSLYSSAVSGTATISDGILDIWSTFTNGQTRIRNINWNWLPLKLANFQSKMKREIWKIENLAWAGDKRSSIDDMFVHTSWLGALVRKRFFQMLSNLGYPLPITNHPQTRFPDSRWSFNVIPNGKIFRNNKQPFGSQLPSRTKNFLQHTDEDFRNQQIAIFLLENTSGLYSIVHICSNRPLVCPKERVALCCSLDFRLHIAEGPRSLEKIDPEKWSLSSVQMGCALTWIRRWPVPCLEPFAIN